MAFTGFGGGALQWFEGIAANNDRDWFQAHRSEYEQDVREPLRDLLQEATGVDAEMVKIFRPNRDVRFSADKSPYKTSAYGYARVEGSFGGLYASISAQGLYVGTGMYAPAKDQLDRYRAAVLDDKAGPALEGAVAGAEDAGLELGEPELKSAPRGVAKDHPRIHLLRMRSLIIGAWAPEDQVTDARVLGFAQHVHAASRPVTDWLDANVGGSPMPSR